MGSIIITTDKSEIFFSEEQLADINQLASDPEFHNLQRWNQNINSFAINSMRETNHSRMIQWLLDPRESHALNTEGLKTLLMSCWSIIQDRSVDSEIPESFDLEILNPVSISQLCLSSAISFCEFKIGNKGYIDILIICPEEDLVIVIENKFGAGESGEQLSTYESWLKKQSFSNKILLHMDAQERWQGKASKEWISVSYDWLETLLKSAKNNPNVNERASIIMDDYYQYYLEDDEFSNDSYFSTLDSSLTDVYRSHEKTVIMLKDKKLSSLNSVLYVHNIHKEWTPDLRVLQWYFENEVCLGLLFGRGGNDEIEEFLENEIENVEVESSATYVNIFPAIFAKLMDDVGDKWPLYFQLTKIKTKIKMKGMKTLLN